jgi:hypothetical protein
MTVDIIHCFTLLDFSYNQQQRTTVLASEEMATSAWHRFYKRIALGNGQHLHPTMILCFLLASNLYGKYRFAYHHALPQSYKYLLYEGSITFSATIATETNQTALVVSLIQ